MLWEIAATTKIIQPIFIGTPHLIFGKIIEIFISGKYRLALFESALAFFVSYFLAVMTGGVLGLFIGTNKKFYRLISPFIYIFNTIPYIAILPLFIIWFGVGIKAKILVAFLMIISPVLIYTIDSTKTVSRDLLEMARSFNASRIFIIKNLYVGHSLPYILSGARVGIGRGISAIIVAEIYGLGLGAGYYVSFFGTTFQTDRLMALVVIIVCFNMLLLSLIRKIQKTVEIKRAN
jgi:NitT/TauT family transport system permease protein